MKLFKMNGGEDERYFISIFSWVLIFKIHTNEPATNVW